MNEFPTMQELIHEGTIDLNRCEFPYRVRYSRHVDWRGAGVYSLDIDGIYRPHVFPDDKTSIFLE